MRDPDPPFLELGFYFRGLTGRAAMKLLATKFVSEFDAHPKEAAVLEASCSSLHRTFQQPERAHLFCLSWTLSFGDVLEFSTTAKDDFDAEEKVFDA